MPTIPVSGSASSVGATVTLTSDSGGAPGVSAAAGSSVTAIQPPAHPSTPVTANSRAEPGHPDVLSSLPVNLSALTFGSR
jgi:hypothetical protein